MYLGLKQDFTMFSANLPLVEAESYWHGLLGIGMGYWIWQNRRIGFSGVTGFDLYFPNTKTDYRANTGWAVNTELRTTFKYKPEFFVSFRYEFFKLNLTNFTEQYAHLFMAGFGINIRSKVLRSDFWHRN